MGNAVCHRQVDWGNICIFQQVHDFANKYAFLTPSNLLDDDYDCQLGEVDEDDDEVDEEKEDFLCRKEEIEVSLWKLQETIKSMDPLNFWASYRDTTWGIPYPG